MANQISYSSSIGAVYVDDVHVTQCALPTGASTSALQTTISGQLPTALSGSGNIKVAVSEALPTGSNSIGTVALASGSVIGLSTGSNSVGTVGLNSGSNIVGKFTTDQTSHGTTDKVAADLYLGGTVVSSTVPVPVQLYGAKDTDGTLGALATFTLDSNSRPVQRIVDAAPWAYDGSSDALKVKYATFKVTGTFTRPNNSTPYVTNQAVADSTSAPSSFSFASVGAYNAQTVIITDISITTSASQSTLPQFNLWLFNAAPTAINDAGTWTISTTDMAKCTNVISLTESRGATNSCRVEQYNTERMLQLGAATTSVYYLLQIANAYTPVVNEVITLTLKGYRL